MASIQTNPYHHNVVPDRIDLRDRPYRPPLRAPLPVRHCALRDRRQPISLPPLDQRASNASTGFALASVIHFLLQDGARGQDAAVSPFMLYAMARRYDEFPDHDPGLGPEYQLDPGSSLRGAIEGWYKHGACANNLWPSPAMPAPKPDPRKDWCQDALRRPLGAYYRVDARSITDMQLAVLEAGVLYASALCHSGWDTGFESGGKDFCIPYGRAHVADGGQAFAIVGYDERGFLIVNSWGEAWGDGGLATLQYEDWLQNGMDCWVAQLGAVTQQHLDVAGAGSLRMREQQVVLAGEPMLRKREIAPFVIALENDGQLSHSGEFSKNEDDLLQLATAHLREFRCRENASEGPVDVAIYAPSGLFGADAASDWIPALYEQEIFPILFSWQTDLWTTLRDQLEDAVSDRWQPASDVGDLFSTWWNERLERTLARPGSRIWSQMKQHARAISYNPDSGAHKLFALTRHVEGWKPHQIRLHLIAHSAGAIVHCHLIEALCAEGFTFESVTFLAPAVRVNVFEDTVLPALKRGQVRRFNQLHLNDEFEQRDPSCSTIARYGRSLLCLVSESFEGGRRTPILGMERYFDQVIKHPSMRVTTAPSAQTAATTHADFESDPKTRASVIRAIKA